LLNAEGAIVDTKKFSDLNKLKRKAELIFSEVQAEWEAMYGG